MTRVSRAEPPASRQRIGTRLYAEDVARAADRMEEARFATGFQLPSQVGDEDLDRVGDRERVIAPHLVEQLLARDHQPLVAHQVLEQLELTLSEVDLPVLARDLVRVGVEREIADAQRGHAARRTAPEQCAHAGEQLLAFDRLAEEVVGADIQALHARLQSVAWVSIRIGVSSPSSRRRRATSRPSSRGRPRSSTMMSGRKAWASSRPRTPSAASL